MPDIDSSSKIALIRTFSLFLPLFISFLILITKELKERQLVASLLAFLWCFFSLAIFNPIAGYFNFWSFHFKGGSFVGTPVDLLLGWAILWSVIPSLLSEKIKFYIWFAFFLLFDILFMPLLFPVLQLGSHWLLFDMIGLIVVFLPSRLLFQLTFSRKKIYLRSFLHFILFTMIFVFAMPAIILENTNSSLEIMKTWSVTEWSIYLQVLLFLSVLGLSAVQEFAVRGRGTPIPMDPPQKLVTTGPYSYIRNPMQLSLLLIYLFLTFILKNYWFAMVSMMICFYAVFTTWSEKNDMNLRFGENWEKYKIKVFSFLPRWSAWRDKPAEIYIDFNNCQPCAKLNQLLKILKPEKLIIKPAEAYHFGKITRVTYRDADGFEEVGICALARAMEHINFLWALIGCFLRLPIISHILQMISDIFFPPHNVQ